jgi:CheY-like chemotaxis protein
MPTGGSITVTAHNRRLGPGEEAGLPAGDYVCVNVRDSGRGIRPEILPKIFDPYFTTKGLSSRRGMGLGLAICYAILRHHGGKIEASSPEGGGASFTFFLSAGPKETPSPTPPGQKEQRRRILFMDDEERVREAALEMLRHLGYDACPARNGEEAVSAYRQSLEDGRPFDAIIVDLTVAGGMGGVETLRAILGLDPAARAIVSSGYGDDPIVRDFGRYGFVGAIPKPYRVAQLREVLEGMGI